MDQQTTRTDNSQPQRLADFQTLTEALEYAAQGVTGCNFYDARGQLRTALPYSELRRRARSMAQQLLQLGVKRGDCVALVAGTDPEFIILFFACRYAGLIPFAMPVPVNLGSHDIYVQQLHGLLESGHARVAIAPPEFHTFLAEAARDLERLIWVGTPVELEALPASDRVLPTAGPDEPAYLQFTSGSTRSPRGVVISERAVMSNLQGIVRSGLCVRPGDRCASWLPFYHDMGLVGFVLGPIVSQLSVDYLRTRDFAIRPVQWLRLISRNRCSIAFSPPFGFELCARRVRGADLAELDLQSWRAAGVGAEMIRADILENFAEKLACTGFDPKAFLPCYGLAEASLAVSFPPLGRGLDVMHVNLRAFSERSAVVPIPAHSRKANAFVNCGQPLPHHAVRIVDDEGRPLPDLKLGRVLVRGPSLMDGYLDDPEATCRALGHDGWLDTGDLGYMMEGDLYLTGRGQDVIIVNGRNIRAQDLEELAEMQPEVRMGDSSAFAVRDGNGNPSVVLVVECRLSEPGMRQSLVLRLQRLIYEGFGIHCLVELVASHTLPRTSSGKLSRTAARQGFVERSGWDQQQAADAEQA
ncbi:MAG: fatty acyl-AMP ligase [Gammaproteobacteria bacterium]|nr:fatty acyl-AMP ligase [Gammaproteobacteria bacterium]